MDQQPPDISDDTELDFSRFHPMDHYWWACARRNAHEPIYGGIRVHLMYAWEFKWRQTLRRMTLCRISIGHSYSTAWKHNANGEWIQVTPRRCVYCHKAEESPKVERQLK